MNKSIPAMLRSDFAQIIYMEWILSSNDVQMIRVCSLFARNHHLWKELACLHRQALGVLQPHSYLMSADSIYLWVIYFITIQGVLSISFTETICSKYRSASFSHHGFVVQSRSTGGDQRSGFQLVTNPKTPQQGKVKFTASLEAKPYHAVVYCARWHKPRLPIFSHITMAELRLHRRSWKYLLSSTTWRRSANFRNRLFVLLNSTTSWATITKPTPPPSPLLWCRFASSWSSFLSLSLFFFTLPSLLRSFNSLSSKRSLETSHQSNLLVLFFSEMNH